MKSNKQEIFAENYVNDLLCIMPFTLGSFPSKNNSGKFQINRVTIAHKCLIQLGLVRPNKTNYFSRSPISNPKKSVRNKATEQENYETKNSFYYHFKSS